MAGSALPGPALSDPGHPVPGCPSWSAQPACSRARRRRVCSARSAWSSPRCTTGRSPSRWARCCRADPAVAGRARRGDRAPDRRSPRRRWWRGCWRSAVVGLWEARRATCCCPPTGSRLLLALGGCSRDCWPCGPWARRCRRDDEERPMCTATTDLTQMRPRRPGRRPDLRPDVVSVLRPFVRATRPVLAGLREADPFGLRGPGAPGRPGADDELDRKLRDKVLDALASVQVPGTAAWAAMDVPARSRWWVRRVGRFTSLVAAVPGLGGAWHPQPAGGPDARRRGTGPGPRRDRRGARRARRGRRRGPARRGDVRARPVPARARRRSRRSDAAADARGRRAHRRARRAGEEPVTLRRVAGAVWRLGTGAVRPGGRAGQAPARRASTTGGSPCCPSSGWPGSTSGSGRG